MNQMPPPVPSPDDWRALPSSPPRMGNVVGRFLLFGFLGQIVFTILQIVIVSHSNVHNEKAARIAQLVLLIVPLASAFAGRFTARKGSLSKIGHPLAIAALVLAIAALGFWNYISWTLTSFDIGSVFDGLA